MHRFAYRPSYDFPTSFQQGLSEAILAKMHELKEKKSRTFFGTGSSLSIDTVIWDDGRSAD